ncbi:YceI family protein [Aestuariivivens insulae]|uniref:YceI family protein n=1 Tax=Aestuariivivens insulae TaxID=1621988 RepID=UPI001F5A5C0D|nr:YceI family protein [Aestuariivivens insulae]
MRPLIKKSTIISFLSAVLFSSLCFSQAFKIDTGKSSLTVYGTSSLHDWHIVTQSFNGALSFTNLEGCEIEQLQVEIPVETLKSGKKSMDKNTYKALNTNTYPKVSFKLTKVDEVKSLGGNKYEVKAYGDLTIAGTKKNIPLKLEVQINGSTVKLVGEKDIKMTDFNVDPPTALFGTITTGDALTIKFESIFK